MTESVPESPLSRSWRDIPQPVKPRAMSRGGKWRLARQIARVIAGVAFAFGLAWGGWKMLGVLGENARAIPDTAKSVPMKPPQLFTDGVLDGAWLEAKLALPKNASLMELNLSQLRARLLADPQLLTATIANDFVENRIVVRVTERTPVARLKVENRGREQELLVARDGVIFAGYGHDPELIATLPWLDGARLARADDGFAPIEGMDVVNELLTQAQFHTLRLYETWHVVSLAHLASDQELEVRTADGVTIVFNARADFFRQLAKLDYLWETVVAFPGAQTQVARIDLSLGREVPVMVQLAPEAQDVSRRPGKISGSAPLLPSRFPSPPQAKSHREL